MEKWALSYKAVFLCVCVEGKGVATRFGGEHCVNAFVEGPGDMPRFPAQLGCQGFAILDEERRFVAIRTKPWNQYRDEAYREVEDILMSLGESKVTEVASTTEEVASKKLRRGSRVILSGSSVDVNGSVGTVAEIRADEKVVVRLEAKTVVVPESNLLRTGPLARVEHDEMDDEHDNLVELLEAACRSPSRERVLAVKDAFASHASHEEALMARMDRAGGGGFSATETHAKDHARVLRLADQAASSLETLRLLVDAIYDHADNFDTHYAGKI